MTLILSCLVAILFGAGIYLLLRRNLFEVLLGVGLMSQGVNVMILTVSGWKETARPPLIIEEPVRAAGAEAGKAALYVSQVNTAAYVDPLPQALILTAIVIGFGLLSYLMVLLVRAHENYESLEIGEESGEEEAR